MTCMKSARAFLFDLPISPISAKVLSSVARVILGCFFSSLFLGRSLFKERVGPRFLVGAKRKKKSVPLWLRPYQIIIRRCYLIARWEPGARGGGQLSSAFPTLSLC